MRASAPAERMAYPGFRGRSASVASHPSAQWHGLHAAVGFWAIALRGGAGKCLADAGGARGHAPPQLWHPARVFPHSGRDEARGALNLYCDVSPAIISDSAESCSGLDGQRGRREEGGGPK